ncbi:MAG: GIY-YIG nuclease family protein [Candidatus Parcubacteria bacterium]|nr:GIY-YIG nuclease family protein [Candidatus Parcubacteria bacterium]
MYKTYWVYIVECKDKTYYTGVTNNLERRIWEHNNQVNEKSYTYKRRPVRLVFCEYSTDINSTIEREKQIKGWSRRKKKALIEENVDKLVIYSRRKHPNR